MSSQLYKNCRILTIEFWNFVKEFMPVAKSTGRPGIPAYIVLDAILWIADNGAKWRSLPYEKYGNWNSFYKLFRGLNFTYFTLSAFSLIWRKGRLFP